MALSAQGDSRVFYFKQPRDLVANAGAVNGTLPYKGRFAGRSHLGQAYQFSRKCGPIAYPMKGQVSADWTLIELTGERKLRDGNCRRTVATTERLVFEYRSKTL